MPTLPRTLGAIAVLLALAPAAACTAGVPLGGPPQIERSALEEDLRANITGEDADQVEVTCDGPLVAEVDATTDCVAVFTEDGTRTGIRPTVTSVDGGDLAYDPVVFIDGDSVARSVEQQLRAQAVRFGSVGCGELLGEPDATGECLLTARDGTETPLVTTVTEVNGLRVGFEFDEA